MRTWGRMVGKYGGGNGARACVGKSAVLSQASTDGSHSARPAALAIASRWLSCRLAVPVVSGAAFGKLNGYPECAVHWALTFQPPAMPFNTGRMVLPNLLPLPNRSS